MRGFEVSKHLRLRLFPVSLSVSYFVDQGVSSQWMLLASFCPTIMDSNALKPESITNCLYELLCAWCPIAATEK